MWLFTKHGFFSVVSALKAPEFVEVDVSRVCIRARKAEHLARLIEAHPQIDQEIQVTPDRDYRFRILTSKDDWAIVAAALARDVTYDNFKNEAANLEDPEFDAALHDVWDVMYAFQNARKSFRY